MIGLNIFEGMIFMMTLYLGLGFLDRAWENMNGFVPETAVHGLGK
jgi:hypothetical protein